ncbi:hypothetical protein NDU88_007034 [Pleurodeles waltl]|uniref:Uncharacterized protein n=1 Tax=Pleurodeles waltl TaxID=8319 RepID=A0AAV7QJK4_PLEWA|nr:hypothetical protein NDU88_007034 [Pleurodeles waltl]
MAPEDKVRQAMRLLEEADRLDLLAQEVRPSVRPSQHTAPGVAAAVYTCSPPHPRDHMTAVSTPGCNRVRLVAVVGQPHHRASPDALLGTGEALHGKGGKWALGCAAERWEELHRGRNGWEGVSGTMEGASRNARASHRKGNGQGDGGERPMGTSGAGRH